MQKRRIRAFTLIEIMIVIAIIAILAGIMVPNYMRSRREANLAVCKQNLRAIGSAIAMYRIHHPLPGEHDGITEINGLPLSGTVLVEEGYIKDRKTIRCPQDQGWYHWGLSYRSVVPCDMVRHFNNSHPEAGDHCPLWDSRFGVVENVIGGRYNIDGFGQ